MGQKTNPIGLRVGLQRKWNNTWYSSGNDYNKLFFSYNRTNEMLQNFFYSYSMTKKMFTNRALLVNTKFIKSNVNFGFLFIFFYKLRPKKIRRVRKLKKIYKKFIFSRKKIFINKSIKKLF